MNRGMVNTYGVRVAKIIIVVFLLLHIAYLVWGVFNDHLGVNPVETLTHVTGEWGFYFLLATLAVTPLRRFFRWNILLKFRRMLGLCSFIYISLHFLVFILFDHFFDITSILEDIVERPYITVGFVALLLMIPLAVTSFKALQKKMGKQWFRLHQIVYIVALMGLVHYWWLVKADVLWPFVYGVVLAILLGSRVYFFIKKR